jgi:hypothetical protein
MGEAGRERLREHFSIEKMVGDTELLYRQVLEERRPRPPGCQHGPPAPGLTE